MAAEGDGEIAQTLHIASSVQVFKIPPRSPTGHHSGTWKVGDKLFTGRLRVVSRGDECEVRLEDSATGDLFATCPVPYGYFVLRVEDPETKRHAYLGIGFDERSDAFDFTEALLRHEKFVERERAAKAVKQEAAGQLPSTSGQQATSQEVQALYAKHGDLSLKEGQTIKINIRKSPAKPSGAMSGLLFSSSAHAAVPLIPLIPPPQVRPPAGVQSHSLLQGSSAAVAAPANQPHAREAVDLLGSLTSTTAAVQSLTLSPSSANHMPIPSAAAAAAAAAAFAAAPAPTAAAQATEPTAAMPAPPTVSSQAGTSDWVAFD